MHDCNELAATEAHFVEGLNLSLLLKISPLSFI